MKKEIFRISPFQLIQICLAAGFIILLFSCSPRSSNMQQAIFKADTCAKDNKNTYCIYIPSHDMNCNLMPLVVIIDPKGSGNVAIKKFISSAEEYKCILVSSNLVKNNYEGFFSALETMVIDARTKYHMGRNIYFAGFSGGARMAISFALIRKVNGLIVSGALTLEDEVKTINTNIYGIFGLGDFNLHEAANFFLNPDGYPPNLKLELTQSKHEWPSDEYLRRALGLMILADYPKESGYIKRRSLALKYSADCKILVDSLMNNNDYLNAYFICSNLSNLKDLPNKKYFAKNLKTLKSSPRYQDEIARLRNSMKMEFKAREAYNNALSRFDPEWWRKEIISIDQQIILEKDKYKMFAYKRIKGYLGILCYSLTNNALKSTNLNEVPKMLSIYKLLEPENPDMFYFTALYQFKTGKNDSVAFYIQKALDAGYTDRKSILDNFPSNIADKSLLNN